MTARRALVAGSYPPVPGAPAAATVAAVRRAWAAGLEVVVVSPRPSAAPYVIPLAGAAVGRELAKLRLAYACDEAVLCLEPGWPFGGRARQLPGTGSGTTARRSGRNAGRTARALAAALSGFARAELVVTGDLGVSPGVLALLWPAVELVTASSDAVATQLRAGGAPVVRSVEPFAGAGLPPPTGEVLVSPLEPAELLIVARGRRFLGVVARKLLGRRAPSVRLYLRRIFRPVAPGRGQ